MADKPRAYPPESRRARVIAKAPLAMLTNAHEMALALALAVLAIQLITGLSQSAGRTPDIARTMWAWATLAAAVFTIWGVVRNRPRMEWAGQLLAGYSLAFISGTLAIFEPNRWASIVVFGLLAAVSFWRSFKITSSPLIQARLTEEARKAHVRVARQRKAEHDGA